MNIRVGQGVDVHQLAEGYDLWLGGLKIPHHKGAVGHSDADVLIHAICDALLGAANLRDIGYHFPDTSSEFKGIDSKILLRRVTDLLFEKGWKVGNVDTTLILEQPKIKPYIEQMQETLAPLMGIETDAVSIKATTNETMGYVGRQEGVLAFATALIYR
ncbi:MAG TPA: 2-C-methyl-D-erythritol 2,4-cyclodiphosphate synthase [Flavobacteriales bacterium]|jgi:2-C-methyl-D-erythritol 2,4-cyclodiphosphate synthase|nr:2-C-methyl-D-erythritol 2,4-cyclodiphosphate synthase [Flavobacteriales bacterium]HPH81259.1 2-C-methyl-D-erythritol 2,4-cyclodiphosphate synthase [Flavobacteriales bacterium]